MAWFAATSLQHVDFQLACQRGAVCCGQAVAFTYVMAQDPNAHIVPNGPGLYNPLQPDACPPCIFLVDQSNSGYASPDSCPSPVVTDISDASAGELQKVSLADHLQPQGEGGHPQQLSSADRPSPPGEGAGLHKVALADHLQAHAQAAETAAKAAAACAGLGIGVDGTDAQHEQHQQGQPEPWQPQSRQKLKKRRGLLQKWNKLQANGFQQQQQQQQQQQPQEGQQEGPQQQQQRQQGQQLRPQQWLPPQPNSSQAPKPKQQQAGPRRGPQVGSGGTGSTDDWSPTRTGHKGRRGGHGRTVPERRANRAESQRPATAQPRAEGAGIGGGLGLEGLLAQARSALGAPGLDDAILPALRDALQQVLSQREELKAGRKVILTRTEALPELPLAEGEVGDATCGSLTPERRTLLNRALRRMTRLLPGCTWTVDYEHAQVQVHLGDFRRFEEACRQLL